MRQHLVLYGLCRPCTWWRTPHKWDHWHGSEGTSWLQPGWVCRKRRKQFCSSFYLSLLLEDRRVVVLAGLECFVRTGGRDDHDLDLAPAAADDARREHVDDIVVLPLQ